MKLYFCADNQEMVDILGDNFWGCDGGVTFWYDGQNSIYNANICILQDLSPTLARSVIMEEIYNGLGPVQDTDLRPYSLIYSGYSEPQNMTSMDLLILQLLYSPQMQCGMDQTQCEAIIRTLYY